MAAGPEDVLAESQQAMAALERLLKTLDGYVQDLQGEVQRRDEQRREP